MRQDDTEIFKTAFQLCNLYWSERNRRQLRSNFMRWIRGKPVRNGISDTARPQAYRLPG